MMDLTAAKCSFSPLWRGCDLLEGKFSVSRLRRARRYVIVTSSHSTDPASEAAMMPLILRGFHCFPLTFYSWLGPASMFPKKYTYG